MPLPDWRPKGEQRRMRKTNRVTRVEKRALVKRFRRLGLTQAAVARALGHDGGRFSRWMSGDRLDNALRLEVAAFLKTQEELNGFVRRPEA